MSKLNKKRLGDIVNFKRGYDLPHYRRAVGEYPVISSSGISGYHSEYKAEGEGLIIGRYGTLGEAYYIDGKYWVHNTALYATDFYGNYPKYVYFLMKCLGNLKTSDKSTVPGINRNDLHEILVPYIEPPFQNAIADCLFGIEKKIELNKQINAELECVAKMFYDYWFLQFDYSNDEGNPYKSSGGKMEWNNRLKRVIPAGWDSGTLSTVARIIGGSTPPTKVKENFSSKGIPWITPKDLALNEDKKFIAKGELDVSKQGFTAASLNLMPRGTILFSSRAPVGYIAISRGEVTTNQGFKSFVPRDGYPTAFVYYTIKNLIPTIKNYASGSTFKEIPSSTLRTIPIPLPKKGLIEKYVELVAGIFRHQEALEVENEHLTRLRDWLMPMFILGQVKVNGNRMVTEKL